MRTAGATPLLPWFALAACQATDMAHTTPPEVLRVLEHASEMDMEWGAAPWSPPGWPLKVGDRISQETLDQLFNEQFPGWLNLNSVHWVDDTSFGARILLRGADSDRPWTYHGHLPLKAYAVFKPLLPEVLPPHLRGRNVSHLFTVPGEGTLGGYNEVEHRKRWHEPWRRKFGDKAGAR